MSNCSNEFPTTGVLYDGELLYFCVVLFTLLLFTNNSSNRMKYGSDLRKLVVGFTTRRISQHFHFYITFNKITSTILKITHLSKNKIENGNGKCVIETTTKCPVPFYT